jgi:hypothetical protein
VVLAISSTCRQPAGSNELNELGLANDSQYGLRSFTVTMNDKTPLAPSNSSLKKKKLFPGFLISALGFCLVYHLAFSRKSLFVATDTTNIQQWKDAFSDLKDMGFTYIQILHETGYNPEKWRPLLLRVGKKEVVFRAADISVTGDNGTGMLREVDLQSEIMDITATKALGLQICDMTGYETTNFLAWCDKVGTNWLGRDLYYTRGKNVIGFRMLHSGNPRKPWVINLLIQP